MLVQASEVGISIYAGTWFVTSGRNRWVGVSREDMWPHAIGVDVDPSSRSLVGMTVTWTVIASMGSIPGMMESWPRWRGTWTMWICSRLFKMVLY